MGRCQPRRNCARTLGKMARMDLATSTALEPARRNTARTTVADGMLRPRIQKRMFMRSSTGVRGLGDIFQIDGRTVALANDEIS